jgi:hypothetical protein
MMGTNYYHRYNSCEHCGRHDERHICKSLVMFRGYRSSEWDDPPSEDLIVDWRTWKTVLRADGEVWDEYGRHVPTEQFIADVEDTDKAARRRQYDFMMRHPGYGSSYTDWLDPDGFSFCDGEFS